MILELFTKSRIREISISMIGSAYNSTFREILKFANLFSSRIKISNHAIINRSTLLGYTLNDIGSLKRTIQYNHHATPGEPRKGSPGVAW